MHPITTIIHGLGFWLHGDDGDEHFLHRDTSVLEGIFIVLHVVVVVIGVGKEVVPIGEDILVREVYLG